MIPNNLRSAAGISIMEVGLIHAPKIYYYYFLILMILSKAQLHGTSMDQTHTWHFLNFFLKMFLSLITWIAKLDIKSFTKLWAIEQIDFPDLCRLYGVCVWEELHTRMHWRTFFFSFWFPVYGTHGTLSDKPWHTASALQTWTFPVVLPTVVMGEVKKSWN